jgi:hypothetical protein
MNGTDLVLIQYHALPGLAYLQSLGSRVLSLALVLWLLVEMYRLLTRGSCDFVTPIVKIGIAIAVVQSIAGIGSALGSTAEGIGQSMFKASELELFGKAFSHAVGQVYDQSAWETVASFNIFSLKAALLLFACGLYLAMMVIKLLVIDVLWPICFGLVLVLGVLAVPLGVLPGSSARGWFRTLVEVALWPVIFQFMVAMMVGSFSGLLQQVVSMDVMSVFNQGVSIGAAADAAQKLSQGVLVLVKFWAMCVGYCLLGLATPVVAGMVMRSHPVGAAIGVAAFALGKLMALGGAAIGKTALGAKFASAGAGGGGAATGAATTSQSALSGEGAAQANDRARTVRAKTTIDKRHYAEPAKAEGEKP